MLEDQVAYLLQRYLGNYVRGLNKEALKISVWQGDVELTNMQLKPEALNALKLPVKVKAGFLGSVRLKVPWSRLGQDPVLVYLDHIFLLAEPATQVEGSSEDAIQEVKKSRVREMELKLLESKRILKTEMNKSWLGSLINTIIGNLKLSISNVHIRYEDLESNPGQPFAAGVTLDKLSAVTIDDIGNETFVTGSALDRIQKSVELERLAVYLDSDVCPWHIDKPWEDLLPSEWSQVFKHGTKDGKPADSMLEEHTYVLQPVTGNAKYAKQRPNVPVESGQPLQRASVKLDDVTLCLSKSGYRDLLNLADNFAAFNQRLKYAHFRPRDAVIADPRSWWKYAYKVVSDQLKKASGKLSWEQVLRYASLRKKYISLYASLLKSDLDQLVIDDNKDIEELDRELDAELILQWRMLAHKFVEQSVEKDLYLRKQKSKKSWWSFGWSTESGKDDSEPGYFTDEDWERLNNIIGYREGDDEQLLNIRDSGDVIHTLLEIHMRHNASQLTDSNVCLADLSCDNLDCSIKLYSESKAFNLNLGSYQLLSPNGLLAKSATTRDSLVGAFCYKPLNSKVDWSMVAKASPCHVTYLKDSINQIVDFFQSNTAVSQAIALEAAAMVQMKLDEVKRSAQEQVNRALKEHMRFYLDLDIAAPKITIPTDFCPDNVHSTRLMLDLGNLVIRTRDDPEYVTPAEMNMYFQFDLVLSDVSAFLVDGDYNWSRAPPNRPDDHPGYTANFLPVLDRCGMILKLQQIRSEIPYLPTTRIAMWVPSLGFHLSPARYHRLMQVTKIFQGEDNNSTDIIRPWSQADFEGWLFLLTWKGVGGREAMWQRRYCCIAGPFFYIFESPGSRSYKQYISLRGKQLHQIPANMIGNVEHVLAVCDSEQLNTKIVEDTNAIILRCDSEDSRLMWQSYLRGSIYRASGPAPISGLSESSSDSEDTEVEHVGNRDLIDVSKSTMEKVFITGVLDELKICLSHNCKHDQSFMKVLLGEESPLFEFRATGGRVELSLRGNDLFIGTVLKALEVEDLICSKETPQPSYLVRSFIRSANAPSLSFGNGNQSFLQNDTSHNEGEDEFYEASENLNDSVDSPQTLETAPEYFGSQYSVPPEELILKAPSFGPVTGLLPTDDASSGADNIDAFSTLDSFVKAQIVIYDQDSPSYTNIDKKVVVTLSTLSFFCRRPTVLAIIEFANAINMEDEVLESFSDTSSTAVVQLDRSGENAVDTQFQVATGEAPVKGLLGSGKSRVIFFLTLNMARAQIVLMKENGAKLATLSQENFLTDIKVYPSSFSISASLGNLRISDDSLHGNHIYYWACDMRNPGGNSFVELMFSSFSTDDEDYDGYEYSLSGQLSEVRIVYLNRFLQEVISYFMGLVPNDSRDVVRVKDQVTNSETWFTRSEVEGSPAVKLDLSLKKPIILMPRKTDSLDYLKLDVVHITVQNTFQWFGGNKSEISAVHLEMLTVHVEDINLNVGLGAESGESIIQDVEGVSFVIHRSLRDLQHQIPSTEVAIKIGKLKAALSNREYEIISECAQANISEPADIVPPLKGDSVVPSVDATQALISDDSDGPMSPNNDRETWITTKVSVVIDFVELGLYYGFARDASLASLQVSGFWLLYTSNTLGEGFLSSTLKGICVVDDREGIEDELRLAIQKAETIGYYPSEFESDDEVHPISKNIFLEDHSKNMVPTMLILDARLGERTTSVSLCIQRPQLLVALDFLLAVVEFFVPTVRDILSSEEEKDFSHIVDALILDQPIYSQPEEEFSLSPQRPLIADDERFDLFVYDGRGGTLYLQDQRGQILTSPSEEPLIFVGNGKRLKFINVKIKNGEYLDSCVSLGSSSSYSASKDDKVFIEGGDEGPLPDYSGEAATSLPSQNVASNESTEFTFELQAISPELTFYSSSKDIGKSLALSNKLLHAQLDVICRLVMKGDSVEMTANALGLTMESNGIRILEPFDTHLKFSNASGKMNIHLTVSDIFMNFTFSILRLFLAVEEDILAFLRVTSKKITVVCSEFDKIGTIKNSRTDQIYGIWRARAPPSFAVLGDYLTPTNKPPTKGVIAVNTSLIRVKRPESFTLIWPPSPSDCDLDIHDPDGDGVLPHGIISEEGEICSIWLPQAPKGYVALGCIASPGREKPQISSVFCILASLVAPCGLRDCININSSLAFWRVDNTLGTFLPADSAAWSLSCKAYELRHFLLGFPKSSVETSKTSDIHALSSGRGNTSERPSTVNSGRRFEAVATFRLIWWNQNSGARKKLSIWRPVVSPGLIYFGDIAVQGYEPPSTCIVVRETGDAELYKSPLDYLIVGQLKKYRGVDGISFWMPQAPPGYVPLGCIASKGKPKQSDFSSLRCIRSDLVIGDQFLDESIWDTSELRFVKEPFSIWKVGNELGTYIVRSGFKKPPKRFALKLADPEVASGSDDTVIDAEIRTFSAALFDDYGGLMVPLCNVSFSSIEIGLRGQDSYLSSSLSFSLAARSYNDKYESWEPVIEPVDGILRYQYDLNSPAAASQLRLTSTRDLNLNISVSNANMILQAYASWNNLSHASESYQETLTPTEGGRPLIDVHHKRTFYIIPQNKLGQDIFIRASEIRGLPNVIRMPSGDRKPLKVPVLKNMLDSHLRGGLYEGKRMMVTVIVAQAEFPKVEGLYPHQYILTVRLAPDQNHQGQYLINQQSARSSAASSDGAKNSGNELVKWNEIFFFKVDSLDLYSMELIITDVVNGRPIGHFSAPLEQIPGIHDSSYSHNGTTELSWCELSLTKVMNGGENSQQPFGRVKGAVILSTGNHLQNSKKSTGGNSKSGSIQISPTRVGPWTTVRLNYAAPAACWRLGNDVVASEVNVKDGNRYVSIRSLVSVRNFTGFTLKLRLTPRSLNENTSDLDDEGKGVPSYGNELLTEDVFETEKYDPTVGWVGTVKSDEREFGVQLPSGWEWVDDWRVDMSSINTVDGWVYAPDVKSLKWPESYNPLKSVNYARQRRWIRNRRRMPGDPRSDIFVGPLGPGESFPLPLSGLSQSGLYDLQLRPSDPDVEYSWSSVVDSSIQAKEPATDNSDVCVSALKESEKLLSCPKMNGTSTNGLRGVWFCLSIQAKEIAKDIRGDPIQDWSLVVKSPISITNYLPLAAEFSVLEMQEDGNFLDCLRGVFGPGETIKIYNADIRKPLYFSLLPQRGWLPLHEAVLISHPSKMPSKTISLRSSVSGRIVQIILDLNDTQEGFPQDKLIRIYTPYWIAISRCPPLTFRFIDLRRKKSKREAFSLHTKKSSDVVLEEITEEDMYEGYTIASALNFKYLGLSASICQSGEDRFGPIKDLSALGDMDGSLDASAYNSDGNCMRLFISSKPCPYQSVPTKVISVRPYMTFTNRLGQNLFMKLSNEDEPKVLRASDARVSFVYRETGGPIKLQARLDDTDWSFPIPISKEDTIPLVMKRNDGTRKFLRIEIRGYEEGSRFIVVFRLGSTRGPIRIENRTSSMRIRFRQSGFGDESWIQLPPLSTVNFSWDDPYGQKFIDTEIQSDSSSQAMQFDLEKSDSHSLVEDLGLVFHVIDVGDVKVAKFSEWKTSVLSSNGGSRYLSHMGDGEGTSMQSKWEENGSPFEFIVELGAVGVSLVDHRPRELSYMYFERVFISYSTGYDGGTSSRFKLILGYLQLDNQLPLALMPVLFAPEQNSDMHHPVFKMTLMTRNEDVDGIQIYPYIYIRVTDKNWRLNIHEPIIWALVDFYRNLQLDRVSQSSNVSQVDPELRIDLIDISEVRLKVALETAPAQRPHGVLGVWSPILSAIGNAFKIQVHLRKVMHRDRFMRKSSVISSVQNRIWRDLIHNPLHLIFSVDVLGMASSTLASLSKGFAELSTDGQFLQLRSKQVWSRRITGVGDGIIQGTEALAQGFAFGVSGVVKKPVESARENGLLGLAHGVGRAFVGFIVQPVSGALDFFSLTVDGIGASCSRCLEILSNKSTTQRVRNPRAIHADNILREYSEREAVGQMILHLAEASRQFGCTEIFKEPSKFAWSDYYEDHFMVPYQRIVLVTNKRVMLLQCLAPDKMDKKPSKILWDVPWEELMALELAKAGHNRPSHLIIHLKTFRRPENFVRVIKCNTEDEAEGREPQAVQICLAIRKMWRAHQSDMRSLSLKVPSSQRHVYFAWSEANVRDYHIRHKTIFKSRELSSSGSTSDERKFVKHSINFSKIWSSEQESKRRCKLCQKHASEDDGVCSIWRPICPDGYVSIGDIARAGSHPPNVAAVYRNTDKIFTLPVGYDLVWRNCSDDYTVPVSIWHPRAPLGYVSPGCVAVSGFTEPDPNTVYCVSESLVEETAFEEQKIWSAPGSYPWACHIYQVKSDALHFVALRQPREESEWKPTRIVDETSQLSEAN